MTLSEAKAITMPILLRIARHMPVKGYLAEVGDRRKFFNTLQEAQTWIHTQPDWLKDNPNEMPTISYGWYKNVIVCIP